MAVFLPSDTSTIRYEETDLASLHSRPSHFVCGVYLNVRMICQVLHTGIRRNHIMFFQSFLRKKKDGQDRKGSRKVN